MSIESFQNWLYAILFTTSFTSSKSKFWAPEQIIRFRSRNSPRKPFFMHNWTKGWSYCSTLKSLSLYFTLLTLLVQVRFTRKEEKLLISFNTFLLLELLQPLLCKKLLKSCTTSSRIYRAPAQVEIWIWKGKMNVFINSLDYMLRHLTWVTLLPS